MFSDELKLKVNAKIKELGLRNTQWHDDDEFSFLTKLGADEYLRCSIDFIKGESNVNFSSNLSFTPYAMMKRVEKGDFYDKKINEFIEKSMDVSRIVFNDLIRKDELYTVLVGGHLLNETSANEKSYLEKIGLTSLSYTQKELFKVINRGYIEISYIMKIKRENSDSINGLGLSLALFRAIVDKKEKDPTFIFEWNGKVSTKTYYKGHEANIMLRYDDKKLTIGISGEEELFIMTSEEEANKILDEVLFVFENKKKECDKHFKAYCKKIYLNDDCVIPLRETLLRKHSNEELERHCIKLLEEDIDFQKAYIYYNRTKVLNFKDDYYVIDLDEKKVTSADNYQEAISEFEEKVISGVKDELKKKIETFDKIR